MKVLLLTPDYPPGRGGIQLLLSRLVQHTPGITWRVVTVGGRAVGPESGVWRYRLPPPAPHGANVAALNGLALLHAGRFRPDVVLSGHVVTSPAAMAVQRMLGTPFVQYVYAMEMNVRPRLSSMAMRRADAVVAISTHGASLARRHGAVPGRVHVIPPGSDPPSEADAAPREPRGSTVVTVSRMDERYKGHDVLVRALPLIVSRVADARMVFVGAGSLATQYRRQAEDLGIGDHLELAGLVSDAERDRLLGAAAVVALPSRTHGGVAGEGFGIAVLEAGRLGRPVVVGGEGGTTDAVVDGVTGVVVDPSDHVAVANAIVSLMRHPDRGAAMGEAGRRQAHALSWLRMSEEVEGLLSRAARAVRDGR